MNLELLRFDHSYPEHNDGILDSGSEAVVCQFNRRGTMLAVGCNDGRIAIWDFMTRGIARQCSSHIHPITSLSWSRSGRKLLSSATDWNVIVWDVVSGEAELCLRFPSPIMKVQFNPRDRQMILVCPLKHVPTVVSLRGAEPVHTPLPTDDEPESNMTASFNRHGNHIIIGSSKGKVLVVDVKTFKVIKTFRVASGLSTIAAKSIEFARRGTTFLINSSDRIIRVYDLEDLLKAVPAKEGSVHVEIEALQRLQDNVNRMQWKTCTFSGDGDYICAGSHRQHELYIWDKSTGNLVKMLTGPKGECLLDLAWHPVRPIILSVSNGVVNIWSHTQTELWSAYAPNFKELDENEEYNERESEFDIEDEDKSVTDEGTAQNGVEDEEVDIMDTPTIPAFCSSEEDSEPSLDWLPYAPEVDEPEELGWGQLEPSLNELPADRKRPSTAKENQDLPTKVPRTIDIDLPEDTSSAVEANSKKASKSKK